MDNVIYIQCFFFDFVNWICVTFKRLFSAFIAVDLLLLFYVIVSNVKKIGINL